MAKVTLTPGAATGASFTLTTSPLQISISKDSQLNSGDLVTVEVEHTTGQWEALSGLDITKKDTYVFGVKPANYRLVLVGAKTNTSVEAVLL